MNLGKKFGRFSNRGRAVAHTAVRLDRHIEDIKINQGRMLAMLHENRHSSDLKDYEYKVFSQWGEDGIIQKLIRSIPIVNRTFIEFGVEDFWESNCRFLMMKDNWSGFVVDGSKRNVETIVAAYYYWKYDINAAQEFINRENVNEVLKKADFVKDIGILSIDIDGVDYHVLDAITVLNPRILICEYNSLFGSDRPITVPYDANFRRSKAHPSHLYFGASVAAWDHLARRRGYTLVGGTGEGVNLFFVRTDLMNNALAAVTPKQAYVESRFREGRLADGSVTFASFADRQAEIAGMPVLNVVTGEMEQL